MTTNPFIDIFLNTRLTIREVVDNNYTRFMNLLFCVEGIVWIFSFMQGTTRYGDNKELLPTIMTAITVGAIVGLIIARTTAFSIYLTGKLLGGKSTYKEILRTSAYAAVPNIGILLIIFTRLYVFGAEPLSSMRPIMSANPLIVIILSIIEGILSVWVLVLLVKAISEAQTLSIARTILNITLALLVSAPIHYYGIFKWL